MQGFRVGLVVGLAIIGAALILSFTFLNRSKVDDVVLVTGMGSIDFKSDQIAWEAGFSVQDLALEKAYDKINQSREKVQSFLTTAAVKPTEIVFNPIVIEKRYKRVKNQSDETTSEIFAGYQLTQSVRVDSGEVDKIETVSRDITSLIKQGLEITSGQPKYFYSGLADLKLKLIAQASEDAKTRATQIANRTGAGLGKVRFANLGVFQIIGLNASPESSWDGQFDTGSKAKTATITVKVQYELR